MPNNGFNYDYFKPHLSANSKKILYVQAPVHDVIQILNALNNIAYNKQNIIGHSQSRLLSNSEKKSFIYRRLLMTSANNHRFGSIKRMGPKYLFRFLCWTFFPVTGGACVYIVIGSLPISSSLKLRYCNRKRFYLPRAYVSGCFSRVLARRLNGVIGGGFNRDFWRQ